jgi:ribosome-associated toxin RatA of RatAB toxin-antitoxin module
MSVIQYVETLPASAQVLFDLTQDYARRLEWDPFPESYQFHEGATHARVGVHVTVKARNGYRMRVEYVSFDRPRVAAIKMVTGPWFMRSFAGAWNFVPEGDKSTRVTFKYNIIAGPGMVGKLLQPFIVRSFSRHTRRRLAALKSHVERNLSGETRA